ncbi:signal peptidase I [Embleya sp. NBC_00896]|uniref:signal peptidase I n=1 Tax=Embleya sp. NBC_00896 TaxID=2975961 RepID=UPI003864A6DF|nr:signal peptidase I [Embleya sp. NBC_00896]
MGKRGKPKGSPRAARAAANPAGTSVPAASPAPLGAVAVGEVEPPIAAPSVEVGTHARRRRGRRSRRKDKKPVPLWRELPMLAVIALALALLIKTFLVQAFFIPSGSMEHTIDVGDRVLVDKFSPWFGWTPERGEVVVFKDPGGWLDKKPADDPPPVLKQFKQGLVFVGMLPSDDEQDLIKRVIGVGGDTVACCDPSGRVTVNGVPLDEPYLYKGNAPSERRFSVTVPKGRLWVMGDHRGDSADSRAHMDRPFGGTISQDDVVGRAFMVAWPFGRAHRLPVPDTFENKALSVAILPSTPVVMGMVGAVPMVLLRRRVRSRRRMPDPCGRHRPGDVRGTGRKSSRQSCGRPVDSPDRLPCGLHGYEEAPWGKS